MIIFGKPLSAYVRFCGVFLGLIAVTGIIRLAISLGGAPIEIAKWFSMTVLVWIGVIYCGIRVPASRFGSYKQLLVLCALMNFVAQAIAIVGIILAIATGTGNIFSAPEYAFGSDGRTWTHVAAHVFIGTTAGSLVAWAIGSLVLFITKRSKA